jgi:hypothetical protein
VQLYIPKQLIKQKQLPQKPSLDLEPKALSALPPAVF